MEEKSNDPSDQPGVGQDQGPNTEDGKAGAAEPVGAEDSGAEVPGAEVEGERGVDDEPPDVAGETSEGGEAALAGWFLDPTVPNQQRYWDGSAWTDQVKAAEPGISTTRRSADERKAILAQQMQHAAARGFRVESQSEFQAVLVQGQPVNHTLHAILMSVITQNCRFVITERCRSIPQAAASASSTRW